MAPFFLPSAMFDEDVFYGLKARFLWASGNWVRVSLNNSF